MISSYFKAFFKRYGGSSPIFPPILEYLSVKIISPRSIKVPVLSK